MDTVLIVIHLLISVALVVCVLLQRTAQDGGGLMGGSSGMGGLFTARGSANVLTRTTAVLATLFVVMSLLLGILAGHAHKTPGIAEAIAPLTETTTDKPAMAEPAPQEKPKDIAPSVPVSKR